MITLFYDVVSDKKQHITTEWNWNQFVNLSQTKDTEAEAWAYNT